MTEVTVLCGKCSAAASDSDYVFRWLSMIVLILAVKKKEIIDGIKTSITGAKASLNDDKDTMRDISSQIEEALCKTA